MGEPFVGRGEDGLVLWFEQADSNHDRSLTVDEMTADADRFFQALDVNHDGEIDPDEIARYENVIAPEVRTGRTPTADSQGDGNRQDGRHGGYGGGGRGHGGGRTHRGGGGGGYGGGGPDANDEARAGRYSLLEIPEPVASADADFNRGVSAKEFHKAAADRFRLLDIGHAGRLALPELESIRAAAASASRRAAKAARRSGPSGRTGADVIRLQERPAVALPIRSGPRSRGQTDRDFGMKSQDSVISAKAQQT